MIKWIVGIATIGTGLFLVKASRLEQFAKEFLIQATVRIHKFTGLSITFAIDVTFINPTDASLKVEHPFITFFLSEADLRANKPILNSALVNKSYQIRANTETKLDPIYVSLNFVDFTIGTSVWKISQKILNREKVSVWVRTTAKVLGLKTVEQLQTFEIGGN